MKDIIKQYIKNHTEIVRLTDKRDMAVRELNTQKQNVKGIHQEQIEKIEEKRNNIINAIEKQKKAIEQEINAKIGSLQEIKEKVYKIMAYLKIDAKKDLTLNDNDFEVHGHGNEYSEGLGYLFNDNFLKIKLFIVENNKPKNKFSLIAVGETIFATQRIYNKEITPLNLFYDYGVFLHYTKSGYPALKQNIKDLPTIEELKAYLNRNREEILARCKGNYDVVKQEYLEALKNFSTENFNFMSLVREVKRKDVRVICEVTESKESFKIVEYNKVYYTNQDHGHSLPSLLLEVGKWMARENDNPLDFMWLDGELYKIWTRNLVITETGNTMFGDWWSMSIGENSYREGVPFTKKNYDNILKKAKARINELNKEKHGNKISFSYPKVEWFKEE